MRKWIIWAFLLLLVVGGIAWFLWPKQSGILYGYVPEGSEVLISLNTTELAKVMAKEKLRRPEKLDSLYVRLERKYGLQLGNDSDGLTSMGLIDVWEHPLLVYSPDQQMASLLLAVKDSIAIREKLKGDYKAKLGQGKGFQFAMMESDNRLIAWNGEVLAVTLGPDEAYLMNHTEQVFSRPAVSKFLEMKSLSRKKCELSGWVSPSYLSLKAEIFDGLSVQANVTGGEVLIELKLEGQANINLAGWAGEKLLGPSYTLAYPLMLDLSINPDLIPQFIDQASENPNMDRLRESMTGSFSMMALDTASRLESMITYAYDDNFERVPVARTIRKTGFEMLGAIEVRGKDGAGELLASWKETGLVQTSESGYYSKLLDVFNQELYVAPMNPVVGDESFIGIFPDSTASELGFLLALMTERQDKPGVWIAARLGTDFWPLLASVSGVEWLRWKHLAIQADGQADQHAIGLDLRISDKKETTFWSLLEVVL